jgi:hypothetical protein
MLTAMATPPNASTLRAAGWMAGWLTLMVVIAVAGREATRELSVFQIMLLRSTLGMAMLWPLVHAAGGLARSGPNGCPSTHCATLFTMPPSTAGSWP